MYPPSLLDTDILSELFKGNRAVKIRASEYIDEHSRLTISHITKYEILVASIAITNNLVLITNNTNHFSRIQDLKLDNWKISFGDPPLFQSERGGNVGIIEAQLAPLLYSTAMKN